MRQKFYWVFLIVALPTVLSIGLLAFLLQDSLRDWAIERWSSDQYAYVESLAHDIDADITQAAELLRIAAATDAFAALTELNHIDLSINGIPEHLDSGKRRVMEHLRTRGGFSVVFALTPEGDHYISHPFSVQRSLKKYNLSDRPYFQQATATRELSISDSFFGADGVPAVAIDLPIVGAQGEIVMHLGGVLHLKHLSDFLAAHKIDPFELAVLSDRNNQRIAESDPSRLAEPVTEPLLSYTSSTNDIIKTAPPELSTYHTRTARFLDGRGKRWFAYDATLSSGWHLMLFRSEAALNSIIAPQVRQLTLLAAAIVLVPGLIGLWIAGRFRRKWLEVRNKLEDTNRTLEQRVAERTDELQHSETKHRALFEASADGILILEGDRFIDCNPAAIKLFGAASRDDLLAIEPWKLSPPKQPELGDSKNAAQIAIKKALDDGINDFEWTHRRLDNQNDFIARVLLSRFEIDDRQLVQTSIRDITERKQIENALRSSSMQLEEANQELLDTIERLAEAESSFSKLFNMSRDGYVINKGTGELLNPNPAYLEMLGYSSDEFMAINWQEITPKEWLDWELETQAPLLLERGYTDLYEKEYIHKDGTRIPVEIQAFLLNEAENLEETVIAAFARDITERKQAEELLKASEQRFRDIILASADWVWEVDENARFTYASDTVFDLLGFRSEEIIGKTPFDLMPPDEAERLGEEFSAIAARKEAFRDLENINCHRDGSLRTISTNGVPILGEGGELLGYRGMDRDITEQKQAQEIIEKRLLALTQPLEGGVTFDELFNLSEIQRIQDEFASATGVASIITQPDGTPITAPSNFTKLCSEIIRKTEKGYANCFRSDAIIGTTNPNGPTIQPCLSGGLWDAGASIVVGGVHIGNWLIGQVRDETQTDEDMLRYAREIGADEELFLEAFHDVPCMSQERFGLIAQALFTLATNLSTSAYQNIQQARYITAQKRIDSLLKFISQRSWSKNGQGFLPALAQTLGQMLQVDYVLIDRLPDEADDAETVGLYARGTVAPNLRYCLAGTPCENVIGKEACVYPRGIQQLFPEDSLLVDMEAESYMGIPLWDSVGQPIGLIAVVDSKPLDDGDTQLGLLNLVSAAASAELERLRDEKTLREERDRAQGYLDTVEALIVALDANGRIVRINRKACQLLGWEEGELEGESWFDKCLLPANKEMACSAFTKLISGERRNKEYYENQLVTRSGDVLDVAWHNSLLRQDDGKIVGTLSAGEDITKRNQTELALRRAQKMEAVGQLTGGISHDFNNILGIIIGNLDLVKLRITDDTALEQIETAKNSAKRAAELTKQLLGFSRQQSAKLIRTDIRRIIREMDSLISRSLTPEIAIEHHFAEDLWLTEIDPGDFQDALLNLAINARDAMPTGGQLTLEARNCTLDADYCEKNPGASPGEYVQLAVSDNGMGIARENTENIFEPFFTTKPQGKGTGLGLAMVYGFVKRSKGYIQLYSELDIGTTFRLYLPRAVGEDQPLNNTVRPSNHNLRGCETILVVDDEEALLKLAQKSLQSLGYRVLTASSGRKALRLLDEEPGIDLLFSDVVMPGGMTGYELAEQATNTRPQLKVLLTSGYTGKAASINGQASLDFSLLSKPYSREELARQVRTLLGESDMPEPERSEPDPAPEEPSAASIEWTDALSIGVGGIDADHKILLTQLNRCQQAMELKDPEPHMNRILDELSDYVRTHFQREEAVMAAVDYPGLDNHRQVHQLLIKQVENNRKLLKQGKLTIGDLVALLHSWLVDHIDNMDGAIKPYCVGKENLIEQALEQAGTALRKEGQS